LKIAHITPSFYPALAYGGPTESMVQLSRALARRGVDVRVLTTNANGSATLNSVAADREVQIQPGLSVFYGRRTMGESVSASLLSHLPAYIRWADVVHLEAIYSFPILPTLLAARRLNKPVVWSARGALSRWSGTRHPRLKTVYESLCRIVRVRRLIFHFTSEQEREASLWRFPGTEGVVIPNGVDGVDAPDRPPRGNTLRLLYLGRLDPIKGIENLLGACVRLKDRPMAPWKLTLAGEGPAGYTAHLQELIQRLKLQGVVTMIGQVDGAVKEKAFAEADVAVIPSHSENFCIVAAEALAHGVPVVASRGIPWQRLETQGCGLWVDNDPASLASALERIAGMPLGEMGEKGRAWMREEFSWDRVGAQMFQLYQRVMEG
jgi:glycosyltransferase involved in cell wall biosynthesis